MAGNLRYKKMGKQTKRQRQREKEGDIQKKIAFSHLPELNSRRGSRSLFSLQCLLSSPVSLVYVVLDTWKLISNAWGFFIYAFILKQESLRKISRRSSKCVEGIATNYWAFSYVPQLSACYITSLLIDLQNNSLREILLYFYW